MSLLLKAGLAISVFQVFQILPTCYDFLRRTLKRHVNLSIAPLKDEDEYHECSESDVLNLARL